MSLAKSADCDTVNPNTTAVRAHSTTQHPGEPDPMGIKETRAALNSKTGLARLFDPFGETVQVVKVLDWSTAPSALVELENGDKRQVRVENIRPIDPAPDLSEEEILALRALLAQTKSV